MKVLGMFVLAMMLQSCNQPFSIPRHDPSSEKDRAKKADATSGNYQRFLPVNGNPMLALDTVTGQLCRTYPMTIGAAKPEDAKLLAAPFCRDLWMASNIPDDGSAATPATPAENK
jgi:hypothetical protein